MVRQPWDVDSVLCNTSPKQYSTRANVLTISFGHVTALTRIAAVVYEKEIHQELDSEIWAYRKAAWAIEDLEQDIGLIYQMMGLRGLESIPNIGSQLGKTIEHMLHIIITGQTKLPAQRLEELNL